MILPKLWLLERIMDPSSSPISSEIGRRGTVQTLSRCSRRLFDKARVRQVMTAATIGEEDPETAFAHAGAARG